MVRGFVYLKEANNSTSITAVQSSAMPSFVFTTLQDLNDYLATRSFLEGWSLSKADASVFALLKGHVDDNAYPHVARWATLVGSFPPSVRNSWAGEAVESEEVAEEEVEEAVVEQKEVKKETKKEEKADDDDDFEMSFDALDDEGDDEETQKLLAAKADQIREIQARQQGKAGEAKSNVTLDVKPLDSETDLAAMEAAVRAIEMDGLRWLGSQLVDVAFGIKKLRIMCQIVDVKIASPDIIVDEIQNIEDVQSADIFAFQMA